MRSVVGPSWNGSLRRMVGKAITLNSESLDVQRQDYIRRHFRLDAQDEELCRRKAVAQALLVELGLGGSDPEPPVAAVGRPFPRVLGKQFGQIPPERLAGLGDERGMVSPSNCSSWRSGCS